MKTAIATALVVLASLPAMTADKNTTKPTCWEENKGDHVERNCSVQRGNEIIKTPTPDYRAQTPAPPPQSQSEVYGEGSYGPPPPSAQYPVALPQPPRPAMSFPLGIYVGPEGFSIGGFFVPNPNYVPPPQYVPQAQPYAPVYAPPQSSIRCSVNVGNSDWAVYALNLRAVPNGPVIAIIPNGTPVQPTSPPGSEWVTVVTPYGSGWVNYAYLQCPE
jgi:hypothetical protein